MIWKVIFHYQMVFFVPFVSVFIYDWKAHISFFPYVPFLCSSTVFFPSFLSIFCYFGSTTTLLLTPFSTYQFPFAPFTILYERDILQFFISWPISPRWKTTLGLAKISWFSLVSLSKGSSWRGTWQVGHWSKKARDKSSARQVPFQHFWQQCTLDLWSLPFL